MKTQKLSNKEIEFENAKKWLEFEFNSMAAKHARLVKIPIFNLIFKKEA